MHSHVTIVKKAWIKLNGKLFNVPTSMLTINVANFNLNQCTLVII